MLTNCTFNKNIFTVYYIIIMIVFHLKKKLAKFRQQLSILAQLKQSYTKMFSTLPNEQAA